MVLASWFAHGLWWWGLFLVIAFFGIVFAYFSEAGTDIRFRAWSSNEGSAPGALGFGNAAGKDPSQDVRTWTHGTGGRRNRKNVAVARTAAELEDRADKEILSRLSTWRARMNASNSGLSAPPDPSRDHVLGDADAPVKIVEYTDFECPSCQAAWQTTSKLRSEMGDRVAFVMRHFPVADSHPNALEAAEAVEAAGAQGKLWEMVERIYRNRRPPTSEGLRGHARKIGLDMDRFERELREHVHAPRVAEDFDSALASGVNGTPTFYVNGSRHEGDHDVDALREAVQQAAPQPVAT